MTGPLRPKMWSFSSRARIVASGDKALAPTTSGAMIRSSTAWVAGMTL